MVPKYRTGEREPQPGMISQRSWAGSEIKFSRHALQRLQTRNITLTAGEVHRLQDAVERAASKGARDSLVLLDELAFVVSIKNRTVITAMDGESMKEHVFTNIDSAVIVK